MKFTCKRNDLVQAVTNVSRAVGAKAAVPALEGILLRTKNNKLFVAGYDLNLGITTEIDATIEQSGRDRKSDSTNFTVLSSVPLSSIFITADAPKR